MFWVIARIGHPNAALFNPVFVRLRFEGRKSHVIEHIHGAISTHFEALFVRGGGSRGRRRLLFHRAAWIAAAL